MSSYSVFFNSSNATNRSGATTAAYTYTTYWPSIIPDKLKSKRFELRWLYNTATLSATFVSPTFVYCNLGTSYVVDQSGNRTAFLGVCVGRQLTTGTVGYGYSQTDPNNILMCDYPTNQNVVISFTDANGTLTAPPPYTLQLIFTPIEDDDEEIV